MNATNKISSEHSKPSFKRSASPSERLCLRPDSFGLSAFVSSSDILIQVGDLVQIDRVLYTEWALYVGEGNVVHVAADLDSDTPNDVGIVRLSSLPDVAGMSGVRVNNKSVGAKERNLEPLPVDQVVKNACALVNKTVEFNMLTKNSEHYVTEWKYGQGWSDQATVTLNVMKALTADCTVGHNVLVNSLNAVLNSPGSPVARSPPKFPSTTITTSSSN